MNTHPSDARWTADLLEQYHDGELDELESAALSEALRESPDLRERLAQVVRADAAAARALLAPGAAPVTGGAGARLVVRAVGAIALAACLALLVVPLVVQRPKAVAPSPPPIAQVPATAPSAPPTRSEPSPAVRIVLSLPALARTAPSVPGVDAVLERGDVKEAAAALASADSPTRDAELRRLGELIRSATRAEELLDSLPVIEQLAACRVWSEDPRLRPAAFSRLERLRERDDIARQYRGVMTRLSARPELSAWMRSYIHPATDRAADNRS